MDKTKDKTEKPKSHSPNSPPGPSPQAPVKAEDEDLGFTVIEAHDSNTELVGGIKTTDSNEDLAIESNAALMEHEAEQHTTPSNGAGVIGDSNPLPPSDPEEMETTSEVLQQSQFTAEPPEPLSRIPKLSEEQVREISQNMYGAGQSSEYLSEQEKLDVIKNIGQTQNISDPGNEVPTQKGFDNAPIAPPKRSSNEAEKPIEINTSGESRPRMASRTRGIALFVKNFIKVTGEQELHENDEITINGRNYLLKKHKLSTGFLTAILAPIGALLILLAIVWLGSGSDTGTGTVVGFVLNKSHKPLITGAEIRFQELGRTYLTNTQGFFKTDPIESGSHKVEYVIAGFVAATDYVTVVDGQITTLALKPTERPVAEKPTVTEVRTVVETPAPPEQARSTAKEPTVSSIKTKSVPAKEKSTASKWANLKLAANVEGAKLVIDGEVVGAGNLTYTKLKPGKHQWDVSRDGYVTKAGTIELKAGITSKLKVSLSPAEVVQTKQTLPEEDYYNAGLAKIEQGNYPAAIADLNHAIETKPGYADALLARARAQVEVADKQAAHDDYIRAAEILRFERSFSAAITACNKAIKQNPKSTTAYLTRAELYMDRGEAIAAIADYDMVVRLDKRNIQAYMGLGQARYEQSSFKKSIKRFKDARSLDPKNPDIHLNLMLSYLGDGDIKNVKKSYDKFLKYASENEKHQFETDPKYSAVLSLVNR